MGILVATQNPAKFDTYSKAIRLAGYEPVSLTAIPELTPLEIHEDAKTREENASRKSMAYAITSERTTLATDEGMFVEKYLPEWNEILSIEPRRLGTGKRLTDVEVIEWHNKRLDQVGGSSPAHYVIALSLAIPGKGSREKIFYHKINLLKRQSGYPQIKPGFPLDSQSKPLGRDKFISELSDKEYQETFPIKEIAAFIQKTIK